MDAIATELEYAACLKEFKTVDLAHIALSCSPCSSIHEHGKLVFPGKHSDPLGVIHMSVRHEDPLQGTGIDPSDRQPLRHLFP